MAPVVTLAFLEQEGRLVEGQKGWLNKQHKAFLGKAKGFGKEIYKNTQPLFGENLYNFALWLFLFERKSEEPVL